MNKKVVIIGGGFCGSLCARKLERNFKVTLIDKHDYFEFIPAVPRILLSGTDNSKIRILHSQYLKNSNIIKSEVNKVDKGFVQLENGRKVDYDYLVIAAGSRYTPFKAENAVSISRSTDLLKYSTKIKKANSILIIGGGLVGVELAGELTTKTNKKITIVQGGDRLIERNSVRASEYVKNFLEKRGCEILFNERIKKPVEGEKTFYTESGKKIKAELAFICTGITPNSDILNFYDKKKIDSRGYLIVNKNLKVSDNIFAGGDISSLSEEKTAQNAIRNAETICKNIFNQESGKELVNYIPKSTPLVISLGSYNGLFSYGNFFFSGIIPAIMKIMIEKHVMFRYRLNKYL